ncbi:tetratricopeptide repeat protein [Methylocystis echinoides]|uniref:tetratricopeptide repeat protein n=1 Tax=Methylocystis echinoides TaxID=29468 RepID=UPI003442E208
MLLVLRLWAMIALIVGFGPAAVAQPQEARFVGSAACASCHASAYQSWQGSQHRAAMQEPDETTVLGRFDGSSFRKGENATVFLKRDGKFIIRADGADGQAGDFPVRYVFGLYPLQQYLIEGPGGRLQAFTIAWDSRPAERGGQRWFDLYPAAGTAPGDPLHWTGLDQNWNYQCAWCHATNLRKNYDQASQIFSTTFSEIGVGCESCHGPASLHLDWAAHPSASQTDHGFAFRFDQRAGVAWKASGGATATRSGPPPSDKEALACAGCHARRQQFSDDPVAAARFYDAFRPATLDAGLYYPDGQQREEVYNFASFLQSRMYAAGVTCADCHDPHAGKTRLAGNALCGQCHDPGTFDGAAHHHHAPGSAGAQCVDCHMPTTTYMGVDARHDHSMRIPRPDRSATLAAPNACSQCHGAKTAAWAAETLTRWRMDGKPGFQTFAEAFDLADRQAPGAADALLRVIADESQSAVARASALQRLALVPQPAAIERARRALADKSPIVRSSAAAVVANADARTRIEALAPLLADETRLVRMEAARALAGDAEAALSAKDRMAFEKALGEYEAGQAFNAERPESQANLAALNLARGRLEAARDAYERALALDKTFAPAAIALAEMARAQGDERSAEETLQKSLALNPDSGPLAHALGLSLIRQKRLTEALESLEKAVSLSPEDARFAYVYGVALHDAGAPEKARDVLLRALQRHAFDRDILMALASYEIERGDYAAASPHAETLSQLEPQDASVRNLAAFLRAMREGARK